MLWLKTYFVHNSRANSDRGHGDVKHACTDVAHRLSKKSQAVRKIQEVNMSPENTWLFSPQTLTHLENVCEKVFN